MHLGIRYSLDFALPRLLSPCLLLFWRQVDNGIPCETWFDDSSDTEVGTHGASIAAIFLSAELGAMFSDVAVAAVTIPEAIIQGRRCATIDSVGVAICTKRAHSIVPVPYATFGLVSSAKFKTHERIAEA